MKTVDSQFRKLAEQAVDKATAGGFRSLDETQRIVYCVHTLDAEVTTGGFRSYLWSAEGDYALETVAVLDRIGAAHTARLLRQALRIFADGRPPRETFTRQREIMRADPKRLATLDALDHRYYEELEDLPALAMSFIMASG